MKKFAEITNNLISNIGVFDTGSDIPDGWIDVTGTPCGIGNPVADGTPVQKPSAYHTLKDDRTGWELTTENGDRELADETEKARIIEFNNERESSGLKEITADQAKTWVDDQIDSARDLDELKTACKKVFKKIVIFLI